MTEAKKGVRERERGGRQRRTKTKKKRNRKQVLIDKISAEFDLSVFHVSFVTKSDHKLHARWNGQGKQPTIKGDDRFRERTREAASLISVSSKHRVGAKKSPEMWRKHCTCLFSVPDTTIFFSAVVFCFLFPQQCLETYHTVCLCTICATLTVKPVRSSKYLPLSKKCWIICGALSSAGLWFVCEGEGIAGDGSKGRSMMGR